MTLRKTTNDNSVRYVSRGDQSHSEQAPHLPKEGKKSASQNKLSPENQKFLKNLTGEGFRVLE